YVVLVDAPFHEPHTHDFRVEPEVVLDTSRYGSKVVNPQEFHGGRCAWVFEGPHSVATGYLRKKSDDWTARPAQRCIACLPMPRSRPCDRVARHRFHSSPSVRPSIWDGDDS